MRRALQFVANVYGECIEPFGLHVEEREEFEEALDARRVAALAGLPEAFANYSLKLCFSLV